MYSIDTLIRFIIHATNAFTISDYRLHPDRLHGLGDGHLRHRPQVPQRRHGECGRDSGVHSVQCRYFQFWSYSVITLGFSLFFSGLVGWVGGASESICLVRCGHSGTTAQQPAQSRASNDFTVTEKAPTRAFSWLKAHTSTFTFKTLLRP